MTMSDQTAGLEFHVPVRLREEQKTSTLFHGSVKKKLIN